MEEATVGFKLSILSEALAYKMSLILSLTSVADESTAIKSTSSSMFDEVEPEDQSSSEDQE